MLKEAIVEHQMPQPPWGGGFRVTNLNEILPTKADQQGCKLEWWEPEPSWTDPVLLLDKDRKLLWRWDYIPSLGGLFEVCRDLGLI